MGLKVSKILTSGKPPNDPESILNRETHEPHNHYNFIRHCRWIYQTHLKLTPREVEIVVGVIIQTIFNTLHTRVHCNTSDVCEAFTVVIWYAFTIMLYIHNYTLVTGTRLTYKCIHIFYVHIYIYIYSVLKSCWDGFGNQPSTWKKAWLQER